MEWGLEDGKAIPSLYRERSLAPFFIYFCVRDLFFFFSKFWVIYERGEIFSLTVSFLRGFLYLSGVAETSYSASTRSPQKCTLVGVYSWTRNLATK